MKTTTQILLKSQEYQLTLDALIQSAVKESMSVSADMKTLGAAGINALRDIEAQLFERLAKAYTQETYDPDVAYMVRVSLPQIQQAGDIKAYYITRIAAVLEEVSAEIENTTWLGDETGFTNQVLAKTATWITAEETLESALTDILDTLENDELDNS